MKKGIHILVLVILLCFMSGCGNKSISGNTSSEQGSSVVIEKNVTTAPLSKETNMLENKARYFVPQTKNNSVIFYAFSAYKKYLVYSRSNTEETEREKIYLIDCESMEERLVYDPGEKKIINDTRITPNFIYWTEADPNDAALQWEIKSYDLVTKKIVTIRKSHTNEDSLSLLLPRIDNQLNKIVWLEGYQDKNGAARYAIYYYDSDSNKVNELSKVNYVDNQFDIIHIRNNVIAYSDKKDGKWIVKLIDTRGQVLQEVTCETMPTNPLLSGDNLVYLENANNAEKRTLRITDLKTNEVTRTESRIDLFQDVNNYLYYTKAGNIYRYNIDSRDTQCLSEQETQKGHIFPVSFIANEYFVALEDIRNKKHALAIFALK